MEAEAEPGSGHILMEAEAHMPLPLPLYSKKHTVNNLLDIIFHSIY